jgi:hypothetical protein
MHPNSIIVLLAVLLVVLNRKDIADYVEWLTFRIKTIYKQNLSIKLHKNGILTKITQYWNMTATFLKNKRRDFFDNKKAKLITLQRNIAGEEIPKDEIVTITGRTNNSNISLNIKSDSGIEINNVWCEQLELVSDES